MTTATQNGKGLTREELVTLIKDVAGPGMAEMVKAQIETAMAGPTKVYQDFLARMTAGNPGGGADLQKRDKGLAFARICRATAAAKNHGGGAAQVIRVLEAWGDKDLAETMQANMAASEERMKLMAQLDPAMRAMGVTGGESGGFLVPQQYSQDIIELLRPAVVVRSMGPVVLPMPTGSMRIPKVTQGSTASYIGENMNIPKSELKFGQVALSFKKLVALVPMSNDLVRYSSPGADMIVRNDVVRSLAVRENQAFLRDTGTEFTPKGLRHQALPANITVGRDWTAADSGANVILDASEMILALRNANVPLTTPGWIMNPTQHQRLLTKQNAQGFFVFRDEIRGGTFFGYPYGVTTQVPGAIGTASSELYFADFADVAIGESMGIIVDASQEAAYFDGTTLQSAFSLDQTVIRAIEEHDLAVRRQESVAVKTGITA